MKNKITFIILFIVLGFCSLQAQVTQEWVARYDRNANDMARSLAVDGSGNVYVTGSAGTIKYNSSGVQQWIQSYPVGYTHSLAIDGSGNVYVSGSDVKGSGVIIKYNSSGVQLWVQTSIDITSLKIDDSGNVYVTGGATRKFNSSGIQQWIQSYWGDGYGACSLAVDDSGNVYVTGTIGSGIILDYETIKYNSAGVQQWVQIYNGPENGWDRPSSLAVDSSRNVYVTGFSQKSGVNDYATVKYNSSGVQQWIQRYGPTDVEESHASLAVDASGNVYVTGTSWGNRTSGGDYATIKYNSSGVRQWVRSYNGPGNRDDFGFTNAAVDGSGNVYVTGSSWGDGTSLDYATIKYNSSGVPQWVQRYNGPGNGFDIAWSLAVDGSGNVYVTGESLGRGTAYDYVTIKYSQTDGITAPSNLTAQSIDSSFIKVNWQDNSNNEDGFYIERKQINDPSHWEVIDVVPQNTNLYSDFFVTRGLKYFYRVKAYSGNVFSDYSNIDSTILGGDPLIIPAPPSKLILVKRTSTTVRMDWQDNSANENGFIIFRKSGHDLFFKIVDTVNTDVVTYQEVGLSSNLNYAYKVCSFNSSGISDFSNTLIVLSKSVPGIETSELSINNVLSGNYPNPFNPKTIIDYQIMSDVRRQMSDVKLIIYDALGKEIVTLVNEKQNPGTYSVEWDAGDNPSGVYFYKLQVGAFVEMRKMILIK